jgi:hypothetical protein
MHDARCIVYISISNFKYLKEKSYDILIFYILMVYFSVSSVLNRDIRSYGKKHMFDDSTETCWNSDAVMKFYIFYFLIYYIIFNIV